MAHETVHGALGKWVKKPLVKLPRDLQPIAKAYIPQWQTLTPDERSARALEVDRQRRVKAEIKFARAVRHQAAANSDPVEAKYWFDLWCRIVAKEQEIAKWSALQELTPGDALIKEQKMTVLHDELATLKIQYKAPYSTLQTDTKPPAVTVAAAPVVPQWTLTKPKRFQGYTEPLYLLLESAHIAGQAKPTARDVLQAFAKDQPSQIASVTGGESLNYYLSDGATIKTANLKAIRAAIAAMTGKSQKSPA